MSEAGDQEDRTEQPSEKRLREARERGDVPRSRELGNVAVLGGAVLALKVTADSMGAASRDWLRDALTIDPALIDAPDRLLPHAASLLTGLLVPMLPLFAAALIACFAAPMVMGNLRFAGKALQPDINRLNPMSGLKRMYGRESLVELVRSLLRVLLIGGIAGWMVYRAFDTLVALPHASLEVAVSEGVGLATTALLAMVAGLGLLAAIDVPWQHFQHRSKLKMTKQELRDELKESEGNPEVKARVRQVAREMSRRRMMEAVPTADVVITNPTHYAVALQYERGMNAPLCLAKGVDSLALKIRELAGKHGIPVIENPPLARALHATVEIDQEIPPEHYMAVAEVIGYLVRLRRTAIR
jgi:flagellar biosynthetic protein FlhB